MHRSAMLECVGLPRTAFNNLVARDLLPFPPKTRAATWGDYSADDAFRLALMVKLSASGWGQAAAAKVVRANYRRLKDAAKDAGPADRAWLFGTVWVAVRSVDGEVLKRRPLIARAGGVEDAVEYQLGRAEGRLSHWAVVDATKVLFELHERATEHNVASARLQDLLDLMGVSG